MNKKVFIIAEAGVNHNGDITLAKKMINVAKECGVDAVKFQSFSAEKLLSKHAPKAEYQKCTSNSKESQFDMIKKLELTYEDHITLIEYCNKNKIEFISTPFDMGSLDMLIDLGVRVLKISSGDITNYPFLKKIAATNKKVILSTGMSTLLEVKEALDVLTKNGLDIADIVLLQCNTEYPTPYADVNLKAMLTMEKEFNITVGYSDHTIGIEVPIAAVALGAKVIEKHFTLDKNMQGPDHKASMEPYELKQMVLAIRNTEKAMGNGIKKPSPSELKNIGIARKSIVAIRDINNGDLFSEANIAAKRPGNGISPMQWEKVIDKPAKRNFLKDELIDI